jgi:hypothetical protein
LLPYRKEIIPAGPGDYDGAINGTYIGSFPTADKAREELDAVAYKDARRGGLLASMPFDAQVEDTALEAANPLLPFGVPGGPSPDLTGLTPADLHRAAERLADYYERYPVAVERVLSALDIACEGLADHLAGNERTNCKWYIDEDGTLFSRKSAGAGRYLVNDDMCGCQNFWLTVKGTKYAGQGVDGICKHILAREMIRLAQAYHGTWDAEGGNQMAHVRLKARKLARALKAVAKAGSRLMIAIRFSRIRIAAGDAAREIDDRTDGWGCRSLIISAEDATALAADLWKATGATPTPEHAEITVFLDEGNQELTVLGADDLTFSGTIRTAV